MIISNLRIERKSNLTDIIVKWVQDIAGDVTISVDGTKISINNSPSYAGLSGENFVTILNIPNTPNICVNELTYICYRGIKIYPPNSADVPIIPQWEGKVNYRDYYLAYADTSLYQNPFKWIPAESLPNMKVDLDARMTPNEIGTQC